MMYDIKYVKVVIIMIKWGFIGCGDVVQHKSGKPFWVEGKSQVVAVMTRNIENAKAYAQAHNIPTYYNDVNQLINDPNVDAVYIATPPSTHMSYAKLAIEAGKPVYVEKPMGIAYEDCVDVVKLSEEKKVPLFVAYYRRCLPYYLTVKKMLEDGTIGQIRGVNVLHYMDPLPADDSPWKTDPAIGRGLFFDVSCHAIDTLDFMFGPIAEVSGGSSNMRKRSACDDTVACHFTFESGVMGNAFWCFDAGQYQERIQVIGDLGQLDFHIHNDCIELVVNGEAKQMQIKHPDFIQEPMVHNVIDALLGLGEAASTGVSALRTAKMMETVANG